MAKKAKKKPEWKRYKSRTSKDVSVHGEVYDRLRAYCLAKDIPIAHLVSDMADYFLRTKRNMKCPDPKFRDQTFVETEPLFTPDELKKVTSK